MALRNVDGMHRGGQLAMAIDRYAKRLTEEEDYDRALAIVTKGLTVFLEGRWLWRRYGCVKWYAGELFDACTGSDCGTRPGVSSFTSLSCFAAKSSPSLVSTTTRLRS